MNSKLNFMRLIFVQILSLFINDFADSNNLNLTKTSTIYLQQFKKKLPTFSHTFLKDVKLEILNIWKTKVLHFW